MNCAWPERMLRKTPGDIRIPLVEKHLLNPFICKGFNLVAVLFFILFYFFSCCFKCKVIGIIICREGSKFNLGANILGGAFRETNPGSNYGRGWGGWAQGEHLGILV